MHRTGRKVGGPPAPIRGSATALVAEARALLAAAERREPVAMARARAFARACIEMAEVGRMAMAVMDGGVFAGAQLVQLAKSIAKTADRPSVDLHGPLSSTGKGTTMSEGTKFFFRGNEVGELTAGTPTASGGQYPYMPYGGPGHYAIETALKTPTPARCEFFGPAGRVEFEVIGCPEYGVLEVGAMNAPSENQK